MVWKKYERMGKFFVSVLLARGFPQHIRRFAQSVSTRPFAALQERADLINFLKHMKWEDAEILETLKEWNKKNQEPLRENYLLAQFNWTKRQPTLILPANCSNNNYYKDLLICIPDGICNHISNPVNYSRIKNSNLNKKHPKRK